MNKRNSIIHTLQFTVQMLHMYSGMCFYARTTITLTLLYSMISKPNIARSQGLGFYFLILFFSPVGEEIKWPHKDLLWYNIYNMHQLATETIVMPVSLLVARISSKGLTATY